MEIRGGDMIVKFKWAIFFPKSIPREAFSLTDYINKNI